VVDTSTLTIAAGGLLDIKTSTVIVRQPNFPALYGYLANGYDGAGGPWAGPFNNSVGTITSSTAANDPTHLTAVGIVDNSEAHYTTFAGVDVSGFTEALITYAYYGDANLDGIVSGADFALIGTGSGWYHGDFNYSGTVDAADYDLFYTSYQAVGQGPLPEPGLSALLLAGGASILSFRRLRSK
jgi:hypothetical protein